MKPIVAFLLFSTLVGCTKTPPNEVAVNQQINAFAKEMREREKMVLAGVGGSSLNQLKRIFDFDFWTEKKLTLEEARALCVRTANDFLKQVNENEKLQPYLEDHPFTIKNLNLMIGCTGPNLQRLPSEYISNITCTNGKIFYSIWSKEKNFYEEVKVETWDEALKLVK